MNYMWTLNFWAFTLMRLHIILYASGTATLVKKNTVYISTVVGASLYMLKLKKKIIWLLKSQVKGVCPL